MNQQKKNGCHAIEKLRCFCHPEKNRVDFTGHPSYFTQGYSIVKDSSADLGVNFKIVQNRPTVKAVCTKIPIYFFAYLSIFLYF